MSDRTLSILVLLGVYLIGPGLCLIKILEGEPLDDGRLIACMIAMTVVYVIPLSILLVFSIRKDREDKQKKNGGNA